LLRKTLNCCQQPHAQPAAAMLGLLQASQNSYGPSVLHRAAAVAVLLLVLLA
jgi:hypothetical protein